MIIIGVITSLFRFDKKKVESPVQQCKPYTQVHLHFCVLQEVRAAAETTEAEDKYSTALVFSYQSIAGSAPEHIRLLDTQANLTFFVYCRKYEQRQKRLKQNLAWWDNQRFAPGISKYKFRPNNSMH